MKLQFIDLEWTKKKPILSREEISKLNLDQQKKYAHKIAMQTLSGRSKNERCCVCGYKSSRNDTLSYVQAHHEDYTLPLQVSFLCRSHHRQRHVELKNGNVDAEPRPRNQERTVRIWPETATKLIEIIKKTHRTFASEVNVGVEEYADKKIRYYRDDGR